MTSTQPMPSDAKPRLTPKLRFPEFREAGGWSEEELRTIADPVTERADNEDKNNILTLSAEYGIVLQSEYFGKQIAGTNADRYLKIHRDDFVYNDRITKASAYGTIKRLTKQPHGIVSPIYKCFRFKAGEQPSFWEWYFEAGAHESELHGLANEGARAGRFNVSIERFLSTSVRVPDPGEQQKIAECLSTLNELIGSESQKLEAIKDHKKGLMQQLFPRGGETLPRLRFPEFQSAPEWTEHTLEEIAKFRRGSFPQPYGLPEWYDEENGMPFIQVFDVNDNFRLKERTKNKISKLAAEQSVFIPEGTLIVTLQGSIGRVAITQYDAYVDRTLLLFESFLRPLEKVFFAYTIHNLFEVEKAKAPGEIIKTITKEVLTDFKVRLPDLPEQQRIASCLSSLDELIAAQSDKLEALRAHKKGLMQQLFPSPMEAEA